MKYHLLLLGLIGACIGLLLQPSQAATGAITTPAGGANLHCVVTVSGTYSAGANENVIVAGPPIGIEVTDNTGFVQNLSARPNGGTSGGTFSGTWDTSQTKNGTVSLRAVVCYKDSQGNALRAYSPVITVTIQNGYMIASGSGVAKMQLPTSGQAIVGNGQSFAITSTHTVVWTRYDDCKTYAPAYDFLLQTNYSNGSTGQPNAVQEQASFYSLPLQLGACPFSKQNSGNYNASAPRGTSISVQDFAVTSGQTSNTDTRMLQVGSDANSFTITSPP